MPKNKQHNRLYNLFRDMVDIYSPSGKEEELVDYLAAYLESVGLPFRLREVDETRNNIEIGQPGGTADTLFLGHIDTVPAFDIEHYELTERDGLLFGLGTTDMKSGCAALLEAFVAVNEASGGLPDNVLLSLVVGEEESGDGTQALLEAHNPAWAIVAEPTNLQPCMVHYGYIEMLLQTFGSRQHAAVSDGENNAIRAMLHALLKLEDYIEAGGGAVTVLNIRDLHSSESGFAVPDRCASAIDLHFPPSEDATLFAEALQRFCDEQLLESPASDYRVEFPLVANGYTLDQDHVVPTLLRALFDERGLPWCPSAFKSHSDANLLRDAGCSPVILGPGQLAKAHSRDESIAFDQVVTAADIYAGLLQKLPAP